MLIDIVQPQDLGLLIRAVRKQQKLRMDDTAGSAGVGSVFVHQVERGKPTVQLGKVMKLAAELGIVLKADVPDEVRSLFLKLQAKGLPAPKKRKPPQTPTPTPRTRRGRLDEEVPE